MKIKTLVCCMHKTLSATQRGRANKLKNLPKKLLASVVAMLVMLVSMPLTAWAAEPIKWRCGTRVTATLDKATGMLTISGTGTMDNWRSP